MMMALDPEVQVRLGLGKLLNQIEEAHTDFLFQELTIAHERGTILTS